MNKIELCVNEMLIHGSDDWVQAAEVVSIITSLNLAEDDSEIKKVFFTAVGQVLESGVMEIGDLSDDGFQAWPENPNKVMEKLNKRWDALNRLPKLWELCWLCNTQKGNEIAKTLDTAN
jgi:hypothetical protein